MDKKFSRQSQKRRLREQAKQLQINLQYYDAILKLISKFFPILEQVAPCRF